MSIWHIYIAETRWEAPLSRFDVLSATPGGGMQVMIETVNIKRL